MCVKFINRIVWYPINSQLLTKKNPYIKNCYYIGYISHIYDNNIYKRQHIQQYHYKLIGNNFCHIPIKSHLNIKLNYK